MTRPPKKLLTIALAASACNLALPQESNDVLAGLRAAKRSALSARARATIREVHHEGSNKRIGIYAWSYADGGEHMRTLPGSELYPGCEWLWHGNQATRRAPDAGDPKLTTVTTVDAGALVWPELMSPIRTGYIAFVPEIGPALPNGEWLGDIVRRRGVTLERASNGRVRLGVLTRSGTDRRVIELNPRWGYMVDLDQEFAPGPYEDAIGDRTPRLLHECRIVSARKLGECWIPTRVELRQISGAGTQVDTLDLTTFEIKDLSANVPDSEFSPLGRVGDILVKADGTYKIVAGGQLEQIGDAQLTYGFNPPPPSRAQAPPPAAGVRPATIVCLAAAIVIALAGVAIALVRGRRRPPADYWGPPDRKL